MNENCDINEPRNRTKYCYDNLSRLTTKTYAAITCPASAPAATYLYDQASYNGLGITNGVGHRTGMSDASGATAWSYDTVGRPLTERRTINGTSAVTNNTVYSYNYDGSLATLTYPGSGRVVTYTPSSSGSNTVGRSASAKDIANSINYVNAAIYTPHGELAQVTNGSSINQAFAFNSRLQPIQIYVTTGTISSTTLTQLQSQTCPTTTANIMSRAYGFGLGTSDNGNVLSITNCRDTTRTQTFDYDRLNRIADGYTPNSTNWGETYTVDSWGNLTNIAGYSNKTNHELLNAAPASVTNQLVGFTYDAAGNMTNTGTYAYDAENRLTATGTYTYVYDGDGRRVKKCSNTGCTAGTLYWRNQAGDPIAETGVNGTSTEEYVFFGGRRIARRDVSSGAVHYYFSDHLGSHSMVENATGTTCEQDVDYFPYGGVEHDYCPAVAQNYKFSGKERDGESGLDNFGARYSASSLGRFMTPDSVSFGNQKNPQSWNLYTFTLNSPVSFRDIDGHKIECANNAQQCQKDAAAATGNAEAAKRVNANTVTTHHSAFFGLITWTTSKTTIEIKGDIDSFRALSTNAAKLADLVTSSRTATLTYDSTDRPMLTMWDTANPLNGGSASSPQLGVAVIDPTRTPGVIYDRDAIDQGVPQSDTAEEFAHEVLGHIWGDWFGGAPAGTRGNMRDSVAAEDAVRELDPTRGQKGIESHHNYQEAPDPQGPDD